MVSMLQAPMRRLDTRTGRLFAEWQLLLHDLESCREVVLLWQAKSQEEKTPTNKVLVASLGRDAVVQFMACFDEATEVRLDANELYAPPRTCGGIEYFRWLSTLRDTWIAHRHGVSRQIYTAIFVAEDTGTVHGVGESSAIIASYVYAEGDSFLPVIDIALAHATHQVEQYEQAVWAEVESMTPDQRLALPLATTVIPNNRVRRMGRKKYGNINRMRRDQMNIPTELPDDPY